MRPSRQQDQARNRQIVEYIRQHPSADIKEIADNIQLGKSATQQRINFLTQKHQVRRPLVIDLDALQFRYRYRVDIEIDPVAILKSTDLTKFRGRIKDKTLHSTYSALRNPQMRLAFYIMNYLSVTKAKVGDNVIIEDVSILLGNPGDLCAIIRTNDPMHMFHFVTGHLRKVAGIKNTVTSFEAWTYSRNRSFREEDLVQRRGEIRKEKRPARKKKTKEEGKTKQKEEAEMAPS